MKAIFPHAVTSIMMGIVVYLAGKLPVESNFLTFTIQIIIGIGFYFLINKIIRSKELEEILAILRNFINSIISRLRKK
jgi:hypothetical protein